MFLLPIMVTMYKIMSSFSPLYTEDIMVYMRDLPFQKNCAEKNRLSTEQHDRNIMLCKFLLK